MRIQILVAVLLLLAPVMLGMRADGRDLTLEQALQIAADHAHALKQAAAETRGSEEYLSAAKGERLPILTAAASASYISEIPSLEIRIPGLYSFSREMGTDENYQTDIRLSVPVYTGGRISAGIATAASRRDYYTAMEAMSENALMLRTRLEYLRLIKADQLLAAATGSLERTTVMQEDVRSGYAAGVADTVDLLEAELAVTKAQSQSQAAEIARRRAEIQLLTRLGLPLAESVRPTDTTQKPPNTLPLQEALRDKPELEAAEAGVGISKAQLSLASADYWPTVSAFAGYSYGKPNLDRFNNTWNDYFTVGAQLSWSFNVGNTTGRKKRAAAYQLTAAEHGLNDIREQLTESVSLSWQEWNLALTQYHSAEKEYRIAAENYRLAQLSYRAGALSSNRLLEIEKALTVAEASLAAARVDYHIAESAYRYAVGSDKLRKGL